MNAGRNRLPWILFLMALGGGLSVGALWARANEAAREAQRIADEAADRYEEVSREVEAARERIIEVRDSTDAHWAQVVDSLVDLPPVTPEVPPEVVTVLDTAAMSEAVREAVRAVRERNALLVVENTELRQRIVTLEEVHYRALADLRASYEEELAGERRVRLSLEAALEASQEEADRWRSAARLSFVGKAKYAIMGYGVGKGIEALVGLLNDGGSGAVTESPFYF